MNPEQHEQTVQSLREANSILERTNEKLDEHNKDLWLKANGLTYAFKEIVDNIEKLKDEMPEPASHFEVDVILMKAIEKMYEADWYEILSVRDKMIELDIKSGKQMQLQPGEP